jgi:hypothetical protein
MSRQSAASPTRTPLARRSLSAVPHRPHGGSSAPVCCVLARSNACPKCQNSMGCATAHSLHDNSPSCGTAHLKTHNMQCFTRCTQLIIDSAPSSFKPPAPHTWAHTANPHSEPTQRAHTAGKHTRPSSPPHSTSHSTDARPGKDHACTRASDNCTRITKHPHGEVCALTGGE